MSAPYDPYGPPGPEDLEARLAAAMRAEADTIVPAGDGLSKIRARTQGRASAFAWLTRPAAAGGVLVVALVGATLVGTQFADDGNNDNVVQGPNNPILTQPSTLAGTGDVIANSLSDAQRYNPNPGPDIPGLGTGGNQDQPTTDVTESPAPFAANLKLAPVAPDQEANKSDGGIPVDDGQSNYVAIEGPLSGRSYNSPLTIAGKARVFEAQVTIDISQNGTVLKQTHATATAGAPELGDWQVTVELAPGAYRIDAYALSAKDGTTKLASDSIWITIKSPSGATAPTPTPSSAPTARPTSGASPASTPAMPQPGSQQSSDVPATEPQ